MHAAIASYASVERESMYYYLIIYPLNNASQLLPCMLESTRAHHSLKLAHHSLKLAHHSLKHAHIQFRIDLAI